MNTIQSSAAPFELREHDAGGGIPGPWLNLVCLESVNAPLNTTVNTTDTMCGRAVGLGVIEFNPSGSAVCEADPDSDQVTYSQMVKWQKAKTLLDYRIAEPSAGGSLGNEIYQGGECFVTATELQLATNEVIKFTFTMTGQGDPDVEKPGA